MSVILGEARKGCGRSLVIQLIAVAIGLPLGCVLVLVPLWLVTRFDLSIWWLIVALGLFLFILFGGGFGGAALVVYRRTRQLDAAVAPLGLDGSMYNLFFRRYRGSVQGRDVGVYFYRGPTVEVEVSTPLRTRLGIAEGQASTLAGLVNRQPLVPTDPALGDLTVYPSDEAWARRFLAEPGVPRLLRQLVGFEGTFTRRHVILQPGQIRLHLYGSRNLLDFGFGVTLEQVRAWVEALLALVAAAESVPAPQVVIEESGAEQVARSIRDRNPYVVPLITLGMVILMLVGAVAIGVIAFIWASAQ